jgi:hypothetical protein
MAQRLHLPRLSRISTLTIPQHDNPQPQLLEPPPDVTNIENDADNQFEVEAILDGRPTHNKRGFQYLVKWLGYSDIKN